MIFIFLGWVGNDWLIFIADHNLVKCIAIDCLLIPACVQWFTISKTGCLVCKLRVYCRNLITLQWYFSVNLLWWSQQSALLIMCAAYQKSNALCHTWMLFYYAFECCAITEFHAPCLPMNECLLLCPIAKIGRTTIAICADYPYLTGKRCI